MPAPDDSPAPAAEMPDDMQTIAVAKPVAAPPPDAAVMGANPDSSVPFVFGRQIAKGGMGAILEGEDCKLGRTIAVKVMLDARASGEQARRFVQEAAVLGKLEHPNIVPIHDLGRDSEGSLYYTMKLVKGRTLQHIIDDLRKEKKEALEHYTLDRLLTIFRKVCDALAFAHANNIIHRDLKPENVMVGEFGEVLVMDWGIAKVLGELGVEGSAGTPARSDSDPISGQECPRSSTASLTATLDGAVMGTPNYMSPEQAMGKVNELDERSDIFSLGGILYAILTLRPPVEGKDVWEVLEKVQMANITAPTVFGASTTGKGTVKAKGDVLEAKKITPLPHMPGGRVPNALSAVAMKALTLDKTKRYQNVAAFSADIEKYQGGFATGAEKAGWFKRAALAIKRNKAASLGVAAVLLVGSVLGTKAILEGLRAERALTDLKQSAPALLKLAEIEADTQRFTDALRDMDAALALDDSLTRARWQRAWVLLGLEKWNDAAGALRLAQEHDPQGSQASSLTRPAGSQPSAGKDTLVPFQAGSLISAVETLSAAPDADRWKSIAAREVLAHLQAVGATGPAVIFANNLQLDAAARLKFLARHLSSKLEKGSFSLEIEKDGFVKLMSVGGKPVPSLEFARGLPVDKLEVEGRLLTDLAPLRGINLQLLNLNKSGHECAVVDLSPLQGMPLRSFNVNSSRLQNLSPLRGMQLDDLSLYCKSVRDLSPLAGMPLNKLVLFRSSVRDLSPLAGMPLNKLVLYESRDIADLTPLKGMRLMSLDLGGCVGVKSIAALRGMPLVSLSLHNTRVTSLTPIKDASLEDLDLHATPAKDLSPLRGMRLRHLKINHMAPELTDLSPLRGMPLETLDLTGLPKLTDISALQGAPLTTLLMGGCKSITDFTPVLTLPKLERLTLDVLPESLLPLRESQTLETIDADVFPGEKHNGPRPVAEFWQAYDAWKAKQPR